MEKIRILVVDDSAAIRRIISDVLSADPMLEVMATARNGRVALERLQEKTPDLVVLDMEMPELDGLGTLELIRKSWPKLPVIMFSSITRSCAAATLDALALGASDYVTKPETHEGPDAAVKRVREELVQKIKVFCGARNPRKASATTASPIMQPNLSASAIARAVVRKPVELVVVAASTGGPNALAKFIGSIPADFPAPIAIVQHMPALFTGILAERLDAISPLSIREGVDGATLSEGQVVIAPGGYHMTVSRGARDLRVAINDDPPENCCRPAADVLFRSAAASVGPGVLAVVMTGMGQDGMRGCEEIRNRGGSVYIQDEASSVVWGMPGAVARAGLADKVAPLDRLGPAVTERVRPVQSLASSLLNTATVVLGDVDQRPKEKGFRPLCQ